MILKETRQQGLENFLKNKTTLWIPTPTFYSICLLTYLHILTGTEIYLMLTFSCPKTREAEKWKDKLQP